MYVLPVSTVVCYVFFFYIFSGLVTFSLNKCRKMFLVDIILCNIKWAVVRRIVLSPRTLSINVSSYTLKVLKHLQLRLQHLFDMFDKIINLIVHSTPICHKCHSNGPITYITWYVNYNRFKLLNCKQCHQTKRKSWGVNRIGSLIPQCYV